MKIFALANGTIKVSFALRETLAKIIWLDHINKMIANVPGVQTDCKCRTQLTCIRKPAVTVASSIV